MREQMVPVFPLGVKKDLARARTLAVKSCDANVARGCLLAGGVIRYGAGKARERKQQALEYFQRACDLGLPEGCTALDEASRPPKRP